MKVSLVGPQPSSREQITLSSSRAKFREGNDLIWSALLLHSFCPSLDVTDYARIAPLMPHLSLRGGHHSSPRSTHPLLTFDASSSLARSLARRSCCPVRWRFSSGVSPSPHSFKLPRQSCLGCLTCDVFRNAMIRWHNSDLH